MGTGWEISSHLNWGGGSLLKQPNPSGSQALSWESSSVPWAIQTRGRLPWPVLNPTGKQLLPRHSSQGRWAQFGELGRGDAPGIPMVSTLPSPLGAWSPHFGPSPRCSPAVPGAGTLLGATSKPQQARQPQEGDKVPSCVVVALDKPRDVPSWHRAAAHPGELAGIG